MAWCFIICAVLVASGVCSAKAQSSPPTEGATESSAEEPPEGYYAFVESPNATPPRVRPPPYNQIPSECPDAGETRPHVSAANLCGDLNRGLIPRNPMSHNPGGEPYPFELIRNHTLRFLSRTLPVLRADDTLPRVAHYATPQQPQQHDDNRLDERIKRSANAKDAKVESKASWLEAEHRTDESPRESRKFCDGGGVFCMLYRAINGESTPTAGVERREDPGHPSHPGLPSGHPHPHPAPRYEGPPTPCPARVEYATPVFARNYQGVWRYVVQIPYEGYFTQTVEVTRCMQSRCHYLDGGCLSSPRWVSLLVAEMHYPAAPSSPSAPSAPFAPSASHQTQHSPATPQLNDFQEYHQYLQKRAGLSGGGAAAAGQEGGGQSSPSPSHNPPPAAHCDGHDELGCYQVRLYYDWFLVPGSCKCWRPDYFARYVRRRNNNEL